MTFLIPDRKAVGQIKYQLKRFENQCAHLPAKTRLRIQQTMHGLRQLLVACEEEQYPGQFNDPDHVGHGCRGLGLDHRWQKSEFSERYYCHKCGEQRPDGGGPWTYEGAPSLSGWYAARWSWDAQEGVHCGACYWTGSAWAENFPVVAWHGPLQDSAAAYKYADDNDPDFLGGA